MRTLYPFSKKERDEELHREWVKGVAFGSMLTALLLTFAYSVWVVVR